MNEIILRDNRDQPVAETDERQPTQQRCLDEMSVTSTSMLGHHPKVHLTWNVDQKYWAKRYRLLVFRSTVGFCPDENPEDLNRHGQLIVETTHNGEHLEHPEEGTFFYTFVLHKRGWFSERVSVARLYETIPSAKVPISRIKDQLELRELEHRSGVMGIDHLANLGEAVLRLKRATEKLAGTSTQNQPEKKKPRDVLDERLEAADSLIALYAAKRKKLETLENDPAFCALDPKEQQKVRDKIDQLLDPGEISAGRERRGS